MFTTISNKKSILLLCLLGHRAVEMYNSLQLFSEYAFQDPQWISKTIDGTKSYIYCFLLYMHTYDKA